MNPESRTTSDTPETDEFERSECDGNESTLSFARKLERERDVYEDALRRVFDTASEVDDVWRDIEQIEAIARAALNKTL